MKTINRFAFDNDGTLIDSQLPFHATAEARILEKYAGLIVSPEEISERFAGMPTVKVFQELAPWYRNRNFLWAEKWKLMGEMTKENPVKCLPGMYELVHLLWERNIPISVASAAPPTWIEQSLFGAVKSNSTIPKIKLIDMFNLIFSAEQCKNPKPHPEIFETAANAMRETEGKTFVVGDGRSDVLGGLAANFEVLYLSRTNTEFDLNERVKRFTDSLQLTQYVYNNLL
ncbi:MAG: HAD family phosphatase [Candidatus Nomurabacteria bacterium]|nr:HAD family phosphatase [Candidatus Nomurabacteria bacterium]